MAGRLACLHAVPHNVLHAHAVPHARRLLSDVAGLVDGDVDAAMRHLSRVAVEGWRPLPAPGSMAKELQLVLMLAWHQARVWEFNNNTACSISYQL